MDRVRLKIAWLAACLTVLGVAACAPSNTNTSFSAGSIGSTAAVSRGTIVSMRAVQIQGNGGIGAGTVGGALAGGVAGSFIGGDPRSNILAGLAGAVIGGVAGNAIERGVTQGQAVEFIIREDGGGTLSVVQTNELGFQPGERVMIVRGDRTRLSRPAPGA